MVLSSHERQAKPVAAPSISSGQPARAAPTVAGGLRDTNLMKKRRAYDFVCIRFKPFKILSAAYVIITLVNAFRTAPKCLRIDDSKIEWECCPAVQGLIKAARWLRCDINLASFHAPRTDKIYRPWTRSTNKTFRLS